MGAQRLSASTNGSQEVSVVIARSNFVLNAFRHQRMDHIPSRRLQVRLAFSAQRLSASTNGSQPVPSQVEHHHTVLNAFRHQRMDHSRSIRSRRSRFMPCAQRLSASTNGSLSHQPHIATGSKCSTPFGINEWITGRLRSAGVGRHVLNAFRHQRMDHCDSGRPTR